jgi:hypothetical protein
MDDRKTRPRQYIEVLFMTLTKPNGSYHKRLWRDVETFLTKLGQFLGVHLHAVRGYERNSDNSHEHIILRVPIDELGRFDDRINRFKLSKAWSWIHDSQDFKVELRDKAYQYVLEKHEPVMPWDSKESFCPKRYHRCRSGVCTHIST